MVTEGAGAIAAAAIASKRVDVAGRKVVVVVTGGNIDRAKLAALLALSGIIQRKTNMLLEYRAAPPFMENGYVLGCEETREGVIIDPGESIEELLEIVAREKLTIKHILLTHAHLDHITGVGRAEAATGAPVMLHADDRPLYDAVVQQGMMFGIRVERSAAGRCVLRPVEDDRVRPLRRARASHAGTFTGRRLSGESAGHTRTLIVGDTLFAGSIGRTDLPGGNYDTLINAIRTVLFAFPDDAIAYPGHGEPTTIGRERRTNPFPTSSERGRSTVSESALGASRA